MMSFWRKEQKKPSRNDLIRTANGQKRKLEQRKELLHSRIRACNNRLAVLTAQYDKAPKSERTMIKDDVKDAHHKRQKYAAQRRRCQNMLNNLEQMIEGYKMSNDAFETNDTMKQLSAAMKESAGRLDPVTAEEDNLNMENTLTQLGDVQAAYTTQFDLPNDMEADSDDDDALQDIFNEFRDSDDVFEMEELHDSSSPVHDSPARASSSNAHTRDRSTIRQRRRRQEISPSPSPPRGGGGVPLALLDDYM